MADMEDIECRLQERRVICDKVSSLSLEEFREMMIDMYAEWIKDGGYEKDWEALGCISHVGIAELVAKWIPDRSSRILDCASGTGLVGQELKKRGFVSIDALDMSQDCLDFSRNKGAYTNYICHHLGPSRLPIEDGTYDCVTIAASFGNTHVRPDCFLELLRVTKPGGYIIFDIREENILYDEHCGNGKLDAILHKLAAEKRWEYLQKTRNVYMQFRLHGQVEYCYAMVLRKK